MINKGNKNEKETETQEINKTSVDAKSLTYI